MYSWGQFLDMLLTHESPIHVQTWVRNVILYLLFSAGVLTVSLYHRLLAKDYTVHSLN